MQNIQRNKHLINSFYGYLCHIIIRIIYINGNNGHYGLFSVQPYSQYRDKFMFYTVPFSSTVTESVRLGEDVISSDAFINSIHTQCPEIDFSFV